MTDKALSNLTQGSSDTGEFIYGVVDSSSRKIQIGTLPFQTETDADVSGPASATDNAIARYHETTGKIIQNSGVTIDDSDNVSGMATITLPNTGLHILDTSGDHDYIIAPGEDASADRTLTLDLNDADRTLDITGNTTLAGGTHSGTNTGDEAAASVTAAGVVELATVTEAEAGTDTARAVTPEGVLASIVANGGGGGIVTAVAAGALSSQATLDIDLGSADMYEIDLMNVVPQTDATGFQIRFSQSSTFLSGSADYGWGASFNANGINDASDSEIQMTNGGFGSGTAEGLTVTLRIFRPAASSFYKAITWNGFGWNAAVAYAKIDGGGILIANTDAIDGVRFFFSSGDISSGYYAVRSYSFT